MKVATLVLPCLWLISGVFAAADAYAANEDPCAEAMALVDARFAEADKARWFKTLETCGPTTGPKQFAAVTSAIQERARAEMQLGDEAFRTRDIKGAMHHFEAAAAWVPNDPRPAQKLTVARDLFGKHMADEANTLISIGKLDDAIKLLNDPEVRYLSDPSTTQTWGRLRLLPRDRMIAEAGVGHYDQALDQLQTVLEANPNKTFLEVSDGNLWLVWATLRAFVTANAEFVVEALVLFVLALWLLVRLGRRYSERPILVLRDFDNNKLSPGVEQAIQAMLINLSRGSSVSASNTLRVTRPLEGVPLPVDISNVLPASASWMQIIPGLVARVFPRRTLPITGVLHKDPTLGAGITIHVVTRDGGHWSETFWEKQFGIKRSAERGSTAHYVLAEYVAIWLLFRFSKSPFRILGTDNWRSYAFFRAALNAEPDRQAAKELYLSALNVDDNLQAARLNLGLLAETKERPLVVDLFRCAAENAEETDATRYQARYSLASLRYDISDTDAAIEEMETLFADLFHACHIYGLGEDLVQEASSCYHELARPGKTLGTPAGSVITFQKSPIKWTKVHLGAQPHAELRHYIGYLLPIARSMSLGLLISKDHLNAAAVNKIAAIARVDQSPRVAYNLACAHSLVAEGLSTVKPINLPDLRKHLKEGLDSLALSLWLNPAIGRKSRDDKALSQLKSSQETVEGEVVSLSFERIVSLYLDPAAPISSSLSEFTIIGPESAKLLAAVNVVSKSDLINKCHTEKDRKKLAQEIRAGSAQVKEWATAVELTEIAGLLPQHTNILNRARVNSIHDLSRANPTNLYDSLCDWATPLKAVAPSSALVAEWIKAAKEMASVIT